MSKEKAQPGLTPEQNERAMQLKANLEHRSKKLHAVKHEIHEYTKPKVVSDGFNHQPTAAGTVGFDIEHGYKAVAHAVSKRRANKHYKKHEAAYQEQALIEATQAGKHIVGWALEGVTPEKEQPLVGTLKYDLAGREGVKSVVMPLLGNLEDAQDTALSAVIAAEMGPHMDSVYSPLVTLPDGSSQSWQEFTAPALERRQAAAQHVQ